MSKIWLTVLLMVAFLVSEISYTEIISAAPLLDGHGGSTIPIPPPEPPSPQPSPTDSALSTPGNQADYEFSLERLRFNPSTTAQTQDGAQVEFFQSAINLRLDSIGRQVIELPLALPRGAELKGFKDLSSGMEWRPGPSGSMSGTLTLPLVGEGARFVVFLQEVRGGDDGMIGVVSNVELILNAMPIRLPRSPEGEVIVTAELNYLPLGVTIDTQEVEPTDPRLLSAIKNISDSAQVQVGEIAYAFELDVTLTTDLSQIVVKTVSIIARVAVTWAERWPEEAVGVLRVDTLGNTQLLNTVLVASDVNGQTSFLATSPDGFSIFALVGLQGVSFAIQEEASFSMLWLGLALGSAFTLTLTSIYVILHLRKKRNVAK